MQQIDLSEIKKMIRIYNRNPKDSVVKLALDTSSGDIVGIRSDNSRTKMTPSFFISFYYQHQMFEKVSPMMLSSAMQLVDYRNDAPHIKARYCLDLLSGTVSEKLNEKEIVLPLASFVRLFKFSNQHYS